MAIITDLPLELVLDIIEYLKPHSSSIGSNENLRYGASILEVGITSSNRYPTQRPLHQNLRQLVKTQVY
jgi:hypothetical protein